MFWFYNNKCRTTFTSETETNIQLKDQIQFTKKTKSISNYPLKPTLPKKHNIITNPPKHSGGLALKAINKTLFPVQKR